MTQLLFYRVLNRNGQVVMECLRLVDARRKAKRVKGTILDSTGRRT